MDLNFIEFVSKFEKKLKQNALVPRKITSTVALRIYQKLSSNPKSSSYHLYCKYQLLRYKPWSGTLLNVIGDIEESNNVWIRQWHEFCSSSLGREKIPDWRHSIGEQERLIADNANTDNSSDDDESEIDEEESGQLFEDWMHVTCGSFLRMTDTELTSDSIDYWSQDRKMYTSEELFNMRTWLTTQKMNY
jgi:sarcosine oxidase delta subunit